ncbi:MAG: phosphatase PAP2 family protein [Nitrospinaceae bacterium]
MEFISIKENFVSLGAALALLILIIYKKRGLAFLLAGVIIVGLNDFFSHNVLKEIFARPRPCHTLPELKNIIVNCSNSYSFPSNHASNLFTAATLMSLCFKNTLFLAFTLASLVGYSRVYLGVHYPSDVLAGAVCGMVMGWLGYKLNRKILQFMKG